VIDDPNTLVLLQTATKIIDLEIQSGRHGCRRRSQGFWSFGASTNLSFDPREAECYRKDVPSAEVQMLDAGHFALDTKVDEIATHVGALEDPEVTGVWPRRPLERYVLLAQV
jgi:hypothetical protein